MTQECLASSMPSCLGNARKEKVVEEFIRHRSWERVLPENSSICKICDYEEMWPP